MKSCSVRSSNGISEDSGYGEEKAVVLGLEPTLIQVVEKGSSGRRHLNDAGFAAGGALFSFFSFEIGGAWATVEVLSLAMSELASEGFVTLTAFGGCGGARIGIACDFRGGRNGRASGSIGCCPCPLVGFS